MFLIMGVSLYTSRVVLNILGASDYGTYNVVGGVVAMLGFFNMAMTSATQRFFSFEIGSGNNEKLRDTFSASVNIHLGIAILILILAETAGLWFINYRLNIPQDRMNAVNWLYQFTILTFMVSIMRVPYNALMIAREQMKIYALLSLVEVILKLAIVYILLVFTFDKLKLYAILVFFVTFLVSLFYRLYCINKYPESKFRFFYDKDLYSSLLSFSGWSLFGNLSAVARGQGSNMLLNIFFGTLINAAYGISSQVTSSIKQFVSSFQTALNPQIVKTFAQGDLAQHRKLIFQGSKLSYFLLFIIICPVWMNIDFVLELWLKNPPEYTSVFVRLALINMLIDTIAGPLAISAQSTGKIKWYQIIVGLFILLDLPLTYYILYTFHKPEYSYYVTICITFLSIIIRLIFLRGMVSLHLSDFFKKVFIRLILVTAFSVAFIYGYERFISLNNKFIELIVSSFFISIVNLFLIGVIGFEVSERNSLKNLLLKKIKK